VLGFNDILVSNLYTNPVNCQNMTSVTLGLENNCRKPRFIRWVQAQSRDRRYQRNINL